MPTVTITFGRCTNDTLEPMSADKWDRFFTGVHTAVRAETSAIYYAGTSKPGYEGTWPDEATGTIVTEESAAIVAAVPVSALPGIRRRLGHLAYLYRQDAIALTGASADTEFVAALPVSLMQLAVA